MRPALVAVLVLAGCVACALEPAPPPSADDPLFHGGAPATNLLLERVARFDATVDYFPQKASLRHARKLAVEYHRHFKVATIQLEGMGGLTQQVLMVQRGTPRPPGYPDAVVVQVPVRRWSAANFMYGGAADLLGVSDRLITLGGSIAHVTSQGLVRLVKTGRIRQHRSDEQVAALGPEVYLSYTPYLAVVQDFERLRALGIVNLLPVERNEETPLGRSEWIKFLALLFNREAAAEAHFARVEAEYEQFAGLVRGVTTRPRVLVDIPASGGWPVVGGRNASARMIADAGGDFIFGDNDSVSSQFAQPLERAYDRAMDADVWLLTEAVTGRPDLPGFIATNPYTRRLPVRQRGAIYVKHRERPGAANPFWDQGMLNPHWDLADHIRILHPERLPDHQLIFHQRLASWIDRSKETD
jgi:iron complex transport system substrate-binding protein